MGLQQLKIHFQQVLRQAQHERNINSSRQHPSPLALLALSLSKGRGYERRKR